MNTINHQDANDWTRAAKYDRPVFALMASDGKLTDEKLKAIAMRILVGEEIESDLSDKVCLSVLGTRIMMGQTTLEIEFEIIALGYAGLTHVFVTKDAKTADICFPPILCVLMQR